MKHARKIIAVGMPVGLLALVLTYTACQSSSEVTKALPESDSPVASHTSDTSSVLVYIKMVTEKKYGFLAHVRGKRDITERNTLYDARNAWWDNPLVVYADAPLVNPDLTGQADAQAIAGQGDSANVGVHLMLIPHADVAIKTSPRSDAVKGTITTTISTVGDYYDGGWTEMVRATGKRLTFAFDTCDPRKHVRIIAHETRSVPAFSLERYTRDREKWEPKSQWPEESESGDWRTVIHGTDAVMDVTGYQYVD